MPSDDSQRKDSTATFSVDQPAESNAAALLRQANRARSAGEIDRAVTLIKELQTKFGNSPEAHVSLVSLGKLLMLNGSREAALQQFTSYLERSGPLEEEALVGRAQALRGLGRSSEERSTWQRLLTRFPGSVYAAAARERLVALAKGAAE
jgi:outer membrane protein assembly factor BamD (BamD/ComL family)